MASRILVLAALCFWAPITATHSLEPRSACPACYTHTTTVLRRCPIPICDIVCPRIPAATPAAVTSTVPGANPACPTTATVTVKGVCTEYRGCGCEHRASPAPPATVFVKGPPLRCDGETAGSPPPPRTTPKPTATATSSAAACATYQTIRDGRVCPMIYCERAAKACLPGQAADDITPAAARPIETETITRGCTVVEITGGRCQRCPRCVPGPTA